MFRYFRDFKRLSLKQIFLLWAVWLAILMALAFWLKAFRPDHFLFIFVFTSGLMLLLGKDKARQFLKDWTPWFLFWLSYDMLRGIADQVRQINIENVYNWELAIFGWAFGGEVPPIWFQGFKHAHEGAWYLAVFDVITGIYYGIHFFIPWILGLILWGLRGDRRLFFRYSYAMMLLNTFALTTFVLFPAAPPWYVMKYGFVQPGMDLLAGEGAAGLSKIDKILGTTVFSTVWGNMNPNKFAAVPSLHGGHSLCVGIFGTLAYRKRTRKWMLFWIYPIGMWFSAVYLNHHYIIDLLWGGAYLGLGILITEKWIYPGLIQKYFLTEDELAAEARAKARAATA